MKKIVMCVVLVVLSLGILSAVASAEISIGSGCELHAWNRSTTVPDNSAGAEGEVTCNATQSIWVRPCLQQLVTGGWENVVYKGVTYCDRKPSSGSSSSTSIDDVVGYVPMTCSRYYRADPEGDANGNTETYAIPGFDVTSNCLS